MSVKHLFFFPGGLQQHMFMQDREEDMPAWETQRGRMSQQASLPFCSVAQQSGDGEGRRLREGRRMEPEVEHTEKRDLQTALPAVCVCFI